MRIPLWNNISPRCWHYKHVLAGMSIYNSVWRWFPNVDIPPDVADVCTYACRLPPPSTLAAQTFSGCMPAGAFFPHWIMQALILQSTFDTGLPGRKIFANNPPMENALAYSNDFIPHYITPTLLPPGAGGVIWQGLVTFLLNKWPQKRISLYRRICRLWKHHPSFMFLGYKTSWLDFRVWKAFYFLIVGWFGRANFKHVFRSIDLIFGSIFIQWKIVKFNCIFCNLSMSFR